MPGPVIARTLLLLIAASRVAKAEPEVASATEPRPPTTEPVKPAPPAEPASHEITAADVARSPDPGFESGRADNADDSDSVLRRSARGALFVPKLVVDIVLAPVRGTVWAVKRYHLGELYHQVFFDYSNTIVLAPTAQFQSGFGFDAGVRLFDRDIFGAHEHFLLDTGFGGAYRQSYRASLRSGDRLGKHLELELRGQYEQRAKDAFYGVGNADGAMDIRYRDRIEGIGGGIDVRPVGGLHVRGSTQLVDRTSTLVDVGDVRYTYSELELRFDERHPIDPHEPLLTGPLASLFGGRVHRLDGGTDYWRYGVELRHAVQLGDAPRVLAVRLHGDALSGPLGDLPVAELPSLGGATYLRGYDTYRFRDRVAAVGSLDYQWELSSMVTASLFVDAGRVFSSLDELSADHLRVGYGIGLEHFSTHTSGIQASLASSIDGGVFFNLGFNPISRVDEPVRRR